MSLQLWTDSSSKKFLFFQWHHQGWKYGHHLCPLFNPKIRWWCHWKLQAVRELRTKKVFLVSFFVSHMFRVFLLLNESNVLVCTTCGCPSTSTRKCTGIYVKKKWRKIPVLKRGAKKVFPQKKTNLLHFKIGVRLVVVMDRGETTFFFPTNFLSQRTPPWWKGAVAYWFFKNQHHK